MYVPMTILQYFTRFPLLLGRQEFDLPVPLTLRRLSRIDEDINSRITRLQPGVDDELPQGGRQSRISLEKAGANPTLDQKYTALEL